MATYGHMRDLPAKANSVDPDKNFDMTFQVVEKNAKHLSAIEAAAKKANRLLLATDPDREGEAIAWHVAEYLKSRISIPTIERIAFNAITKKAVLEALETPRAIDQNLVDAYLARLSLDYLVGFTLSPLLWRKLPGCRSAGRVQSVALRILCDREHDIETFVSQEYWTIEGLFNQGETTIQTQMVELNGKKLEKFSLPDETHAKAAVKTASADTYTLTSVQKKQVSRNPAAPFMTSTLQQEASRKLGLGATRTMRLAQQLYEGINGEEGLITYMRTDSTTMTGEAIQQARKTIQTVYGKEFVSPDVRVYKRKARNAQEAHEAIRPTQFDKTPKSLMGKIDKDLWALYDIIWRRAVASQMASALFDQVTFILTHPEEKARFKATGRTCRFRGFLEVYLEGKDDEPDDDETKTLPPLKEGMTLALKKLVPHQHFTEPPPRFSEASLIKKMEELGIGRPSTYARIIQVLKDRDYVLLQKKQLVPKEKGRVVTSFLTHFFTRYVENDFTATLEESLDAISRGDRPWRDLLQDFWVTFKNTIDQTATIKTVDVLQHVEAALADHFFKDKDRTCQACKTGQMHLRLGKFGPFLGCNNYPDCKNMISLNAPAAEESDVAAQGEKFPRTLGEDPNLKQTITVRKGPYGFYLQWGEDKKPKRLSLPKALSPSEVTLTQAAALGKLPFTVGQHPDTGGDIVLNIGRFGPYASYDKKFFSIKNIDLLLQPNLHEILRIIAAKKVKS